MKKIFKYLLGSLLIVGTVGSIWYFTGQRNQTQNSLQVERRTLTQVVKVSGTVVPQEKAELAFESKGRVTDIAVEIGQEVSTGDVLARQDKSEIEARIAESQAKLNSQRAKVEQIVAALESEEALLSETKQGTRQEELQIAQTEVKNQVQTLSDRQKILADEEQVALERLEKDQKAVEDAERNLRSVQAQNQIELDNLYQDIPDIARRALNFANDALFVKTSQLFIGNRFTNESNSNINLYGSFEPTFRVEFDFSGREEEASSKRSDALLKLNEWEENSSISDAPSQEDWEDILEEAQEGSEVILEYLQAARELLRSAASSEDQTTINQYQDDVNQAEEQVVNVISDINQQLQAISSQKATNTTNLTAAEEKLNAAKNQLELTKISNQQSIFTAKADVNEASNALNMAQDELSLKEAGSRAEQVVAQKAQVKQEEARLKVEQAVVEQIAAEIKSLQAERDKLILVSPIDGIVSRQDGEKGEIIDANEIFVHVISAGNYEVEANIPEINIAKISKGQIGSVTLDAYGDDLIFEAEIMSIDPAETLVDDVPNYEITLRFMEQDDRILSGMTANLIIETERQEDLLSLPQYALNQDNEGWYVLVPTERPRFPEKKRVEVGFRSSDGFVSIEKGLSEGETIVIDASE